MKRRFHLVWYVIPAAALAALFVPWSGIDHNSIKQNDAAAIGRLRTLYRDEANYALRSQKNAFACHLSELSQPAEYSGYRFTVTCPNEAEARQYRITAEPITLRKTGLHAYCISEAGVIWWDAEGSGEMCLRTRQVWAGT